MHRQLPAFVTEGRFVAARPFILNGKKLSAGDPISGDINERRLRQLYDRRMVTYAEANGGSAGKGRK